MDNPNVIACLRAADGNVDALNVIRGDRRCIFPPQMTVQERGSRESTISVPDDRDNDTRDDEFLSLTFDQPPKDGKAFVIGSDRKCCDILLPNYRGISGRHCCITFNENRRLILRDYSKNGTTVTYDGQGGAKRKHFTWILSHQSLEAVEEILVHIQRIKFQIGIPKERTCQAAFNTNLDRFLLQASADDELPLSGLGIQSAQSTEPHSGADTPQTWILIDHGFLGSGSFSNVRSVWDVSTGQTYASKEIINRNNATWTKEISILRQVSQLGNKHIVHFVGFIEGPPPQLILEYVALGSLRDTHIDDHEGLALLCQCLDALTSVHSQNIVHRDIKPDNILVQSRHPLHIKLSDFGLSKATASLRTACGTHQYAAPEIYPPRRAANYTEACDIWSLGVVVFEFVYGPLPEFRGEDAGDCWARKIMACVNGWESDEFLEFLSTAMLVIEPESRLTAVGCWQQAMNLSSTLRCTTPTPTSYTLGQHQIGGCPQDRAAVDPDIRLTPGPAESQTQLLGLKDSAKQTGDQAVASTSSRRAAKSYEPCQPVRVYSGPFSRSPYDAWEGYAAIQPPATDPATTQINTEPISQEPVTKRARVSSENPLPKEKPLPKVTDFFDDRFVQMTFGDQLVLMRKTDGYLNATQIIGLTGKTSNQRTNILRSLKQKTNVEVLPAIKGLHHSSSWLCFDHGKLLWMDLGLRQDLGPLEDYWRRVHQNETGKFGSAEGSKHLFAVDHGFFRLYVGSQPVSVRKKDLRVNASHIIRACDLSLRITAAIRAEFAFDMEKRGCHPPHQGTYVDYEVGLELCRRYRLFELEEQLLGLKPCLNADAITKTLSQQLARDATSRRRSASFEADQRRDPGISAYEDPVPDHMQEATCGTTDKLTKCDKGSKRSHIGHPDSVLDEDRYSFIVEPSNKYGSFLLPSSWQSRFSS